MLVVLLLLIAVVLTGAFQRSFPSAEDLAERCSNATKTLNRRVEGPGGVMYW